MATVLLFSAIPSMVQAQNTAPISEIQEIVVDHSRQMRIETISADLGKLRSKPSLSEYELQTIRKKIQNIAADKGQNDSGILFRSGEDADVIINDIMFQGMPSALNVIVDFNKELQERGIDLIVIPVPNQIQVYLNRLYPDMNPYAEIWPSYSDGLVQLLENDVEVIDLRDSFISHKPATALEEALLPYDHHMNSQGMRILATSVYERILRYPWAQKSRLGSARYKQYDVEINADISLARTFLGKVKNLPWGDDWTPPEKQLMRQIEDTFGNNSAGSINPLLIIGDSLSFSHAAYPVGRGFPNHLSFLMGFPVPFAGQAGGSNASILNYSRWFSDVSPQPEVILLIVRAASLTRTNWIPSSMPPIESGNEDNTYAGGILSRSETIAERKVVGAQITSKKNLQVFGKVITASSLPDPETAVYKDILIVNEVQVLLGGEKGPINTIQWAMKDFVLRNGANMREGKYYWFELMPWASFGRGNSLQSIMQINDSTNFDAEQYWALNVIPCLIDLVAPEYVSQKRNPHLRNVEKTPNVNGGVLFFGDFSTMPLSKYDIKPHLGKTDVTVFSGNNDSLENILWRGLSGELEVNPKILVFTIWPINYKSYTEEEISQSLIIMAKIIAQHMPDSIVVFVSMLPDSSRIAEIKGINNLMGSFASPGKFVYINVNSLYSRVGFPETPLFQWDGYLTPKAKRIWIEIVTSKLQPLLH